jgi:phosphoglycolate phosphatase
VKGQKKEISTRQESRLSSRPDVLYFLPTAHFLIQLPTHIAHIAKAPQANATTKALSKSAITQHGFNNMNLVIFDLDGVLFDSRKIKIESFKKTFGYFNITNLPDEIKLLDTLRPSDIFKEFEIDLKSLSNYYSEIYENELLKFDLFLDFTKLNDLKSENLRFALFTAQPMKRVKMIFSNIEFDLFDIIISEEELKGKSKSESNGLTQIINTLNPNDSYFIGDTIDDIKAAKKNGVKSIFATWGYTPIEKVIKYKPDIVFYKPIEVYNFLEELS